MPLILSKPDYYSKNIQERLETDLEGNVYLDGAQVVSTTTELDKGKAYYYED